MLTRHDLDKMIYDIRPEDVDNPVVLFYDTDGNEYKIKEVYTDNEYVCIDLEKKEGITPDA